MQVNKYEWSKTGIGNFGPGGPLSCRV